MRPWRCRACDSRFFAWAAPIGYVWYVHCGMCGNMGVQRSTTFSVVPEVNLNLHYQLTSNLRATLGYSFLYGMVAYPQNVSPT